MRHLVIFFAFCLILLFAFGCNGKGAPATVAAAAPGTVKVTVQSSVPKAGEASPVRLHITVDGKPLDGATVHGVLTMTNMDMGKTDVEFAAKGGGDYEGKIVFDMGGPWKIDLTIKHDGQTASAAVNINVPE